MSNRISWVSLVLALVMLLSSGMTVSAQDNDVHLPLISNEAEPPLGPLAPGPNRRSGRNLAKATCPSLSWMPSPSPPIRATS